MSGIQILLVIIGTLTISYMAGAIIKAKSIPESISATSYIWESNCAHKSLHKAGLFSLYCALVAGMIFWPWVSQTSEYWQFLSFLGCTGILAAGSTPFFRESYQARIHYSGGIIAMISWLMWMIVNSFHAELGWCAGIILILCCIKRRPWVLWGELVGLFGLLYCLY